VLDLCAGTGAVGLEALSRGAAHATFVDADARACRLIARNVAKCQLREGYTILRSSIEQTCLRLAGEFSLVFLDPPYEAPGLDRWVELAAAKVSPGGLLVVEHARLRRLAARAGSLQRTRELPSGDSMLSFYRWPSAEATSPAGDTV
jgi:16S rRNA (guanine(966)-N(2))-methyltransferase RsmD